MKFIKFKLNIQDFLKRYLILSLIIIILNFIFFSFLDNFYYLTLIDYPIYDIYIINLLSTILIISIIYFIFIKNKKKNINSIKLDIYRIQSLIPKISLIVLIGTILFLISKLTYYSYYFYEIPHITCIPNKFKSFWSNQSIFLENLKDKSMIRFLIYETISPIGTILINFLYLLIFIKIICLKNLNFKEKLGIDLILYFSLIVYHFLTGSKMVLLATLVFYFTNIALLFILRKKFLYHLKPFLIFSFFLILMIFSNQLLRYKCISQDFSKKDIQLTHDLELNRLKEIDLNERPSFKFNFKEKNDLDMFKENIIDEAFLNSRSELSKTEGRARYMTNYILYYLLTGKNHGDLNIVHKDEFKFNFITIKKIINLFYSDLSKIFQFKDKNLFELPNLKKNLGPVSLMAFAYLDFNHFGLSLIIIFPLIIYVFFKFIRLGKIKFYAINLLFFNIVLFNIVLLFIGYANLFLNVRIFFLIYLFFILYLFKKNFIKIID